MISQRQMKEWIPEAVERFRAVMPPIDVPYPEFMIASAKTGEKLRASTVERLHSPQTHTGEPAMAETIHGELGTAIIIYQNNHRENPYNRELEKHSFLHVCWHELGHFYAFSTECPGAELFRYVDQQPRYGIEASKQIGYWVWMEFIAESIACHIDPDVEIKWDQFNWYPIRNDIRSLIREAFTKYPDSMDEYALGHYFAGILANKTMTAFLRAAEDGRARASRRLGYGSGTVTLCEAGIDPDCRSEVSEDYYPYLDDLEKLLREQLRKEEYWKIDPSFLLQLSEPTTFMSMIRKMNDTTGELGNKLRWLLSLESNK